MLDVINLGCNPTEEGTVLNALRSKRNRPYLHALVLVLLVSLVSVLVFSTCAMPVSWRMPSSQTMPAGCSEQAHHAQEHKGHQTAPTQDCSFKPCLDAQPNQVFGYKVDKPDLPVFILSLIWIIGVLLLGVQSERISRITAPPDGRRIPLIYQFCSLLN